MTSLLDWVEIHQGEKPAPVIKQTDKALHEKVMTQNQQDWQCDGVERNRND